MRLALNGFGTSPSPFNDPNDPLYVATDGGYGQSYDPASGSAVLKVGARGALVSDLQATLVGAGYTIGIDGTFGPETLAAVRAFQAAHPPLTVDGVVGPRTWVALRQVVPATTKVVVTNSVGQAVSVPVKTGPDLLDVQPGQSEGWWSGPVVPAIGGTLIGALVGGVAYGRRGDRVVTAAIGGVAGGLVGLLLSFAVDGKWQA